MSILTIVLGVAAIWFFLLYRRSVTKRHNQTSYAIYLLYSSDIRNDHRKKFRDYLVSKGDIDERLLTAKALLAVEDMADQLGSQLSVAKAAAMIKTLKDEPNA